MSFVGLKKSLYKVPSRVQDTIYIEKVNLDTGIFYHGKDIYTKQYEFTDVNYEVISESDKEDIVAKWCQLINSFSSGGEFKITLNNRRIDEKTLDDSAFLKMRGDQNDVYRKELNENLREKLAACNNIDTQLLFTLRVTARDFQDAHAQFDMMEKSVRAKLSEIGSDFTALTYLERFRVLYNIYRNGEEDFFQFDPHKGFYLHDFRDYICPDTIEIFPDYLKLGEKYVRTLFLKYYANQVNDDVLHKTLNIPKTACLSIDIKVMDPSQAKDLLEKHLFNVSGDITKWQRSQNKHDNYTAEIPYDLKQPRDEAEAQLADLCEHDQNLCYTWVSIMLMADSLEELDSDTELVILNGKKNNMTLMVPKQYQIEALNTAIPVGVNQHLMSRLLMTICAATLMPFRTQNILHKNGVYYGINPLSKKLLTVNRDYLINQNSFVLGAPGSGKSFITKAEIMALMLRGDTDIILIDPEAEYGSLTKALGGELIVLDAAKNIHINALDLTAEYSQEESNPIAVKSDFVMSLIARINGGEILPEERSIIDRCLKKVYKNYIRSGYKGTNPTLVDFKDVLEQQNDPVASRLATVLEYFTSGSANLFAQQSNVDVNSTLVCYDILNLGRQLKPLAMLVVLDAIFNRMAKNRNLGRKTAIFIDEIYLLFQDQFSEDYLKVLWKRCRKYGARMTGITQNIEDLLVSDSARKMLNTSEFLILLSQSGTDKFELAKLLNIPPVQMPYISTGQYGEGLLKVGKAIVPFENKFRDDTQIYKLLTSKMTDLHPEDLTQQREYMDIYSDDDDEDAPAQPENTQSQPEKEEEKSPVPEAPLRADGTVETPVPSTAPESPSEPSQAENSTAVAPEPAQPVQSQPERPAYTGDTILACNPATYPGEPYHQSEDSSFKTDYNFMEAQEPEAQPVVAQAEVPQPEITEPQSVPQTPAAPESSGEGGQPSEQPVTLNDALDAQ